MNTSKHFDNNKAEDSMLNILVVGGEEYTIIEDLKKRANKLQTVPLSRPFACAVLKAEPSVREVSTGPALKAAGLPSSQ